MLVSQYIAFILFNFKLLEFTQSYDHSSFGAKEKDKSDNTLSSLNTWGGKKNKNKKTAMYKKL